MIKYPHILELEGWICLVLEDMAAPAVTVAVPADSTVVIMEVPAGSMAAITATDPLPLTTAGAGDGAMAEAAAAACCR